ncbi:phage minor head protein [Porcipelethomonas sp.]|uniref:phage minor head protein n=1 Tax=Porcipelethomonas sp. TaxID=2981675 RepID=UPI00206B3B4A|nr:MAG TPA: minor capsid protein [Caudoviricetes sp.]
MPKAEQSLNDLLHEIRRIEQSREVLTEKKIRKIYKQLLKELNHFLADEYLKYSKDGILTVAMLQEKSRYAKFLEEIESHVNNLTPEIVALIKNTVEDTYTACYKGMSESVLKAKDTKSALNYLKDLSIRPEVMKRAIENPVSGLTLPDILEKNRKEVIYDIKQQVNIGLMNGDRYETTAKKVAERLDISYGKATNIVRTETHRVTESGFMDCAKDISDSLDGSGLVYTAAWRTMKDERVRPQHRYRTKSGWKTSISRNGANHQKMEGVIIQVGDKFQLEPNVYAECPSTSGTARNDCRCRCFLEYTLMSVEKFEELTGKSVDKSGGSGIIKTDEVIGRSVGAAGKNYPVKLPDGNHSKFAEGSTISKIKVFAGDGTDTPIRNAIYLECDYGIPAEKWQKVRGEGTVVFEGKKRIAEIHWYEADNEKYDMKVKRWLDEG